MRPTRTGAFPLTDSVDTSEGEFAAGPLDWVPATGERLDWCVGKLRQVAGGPPRFAPPEHPRAMQIALELPKAFDARPTRSRILAASARAVAMFCLDARVAPGGQWHEEYTLWVDSQMRKVARRARGGHWKATETLEGVEARDGDAVARVFVPSIMDSVDPLIQRLQVGGTDAPSDAGDAAAEGTSGVILLVDKQLEMTAGKAAAQAGHAIMLLLAVCERERVDAWIREGMPITVHGASPEEWAKAQAGVAARAPGYAGVRDAGYTEVAPGSLTVIAVDSATAKSQ